MEVLNKLIKVGYLLIQLQVKIILLLLRTEPTINNVSISTEIWTLQWAIVLLTQTNNSNGKPMNGLYLMLNGT